MCTSYIAKTIVKFLPETGLAPLTVKQALLSCQCSILSRASINHAESVPTDFATLLTLIINIYSFVATKNTTLVY